MKRAVCSAITGLIFSAFCLYAADINGKWSAEVAGRDGEKRTQTFDFKTEGEKLTGTISNPMGQRQIEDGKVSGDTISFSITVEFGGQSRKINYTGKVVGEEIQFKSGSGERVREFTAKRATS